MRNWGLHQYLHGYSALSDCKRVLGIASTSLWLLSPVTLQMGTGDCISIFVDTQPCHTANGNWGFTIASVSSWLLSPVTLQMGTGDCINFFMAAQPCNTANGNWGSTIASVSSWLLSPVTLQKGTGDCINIFMAVQPCNTANGYWDLHQYLYGYSALSHRKWELGIASISSWLLSPVTLQMGTGDCINIFLAAQPCNTANGY